LEFNFFIYVKSRRQNLEFVIQVLIFFIWNELKLEDFEKKVNCKAKVKSSLTTLVQAENLEISSKISIS